MIKIDSRWSRFNDSFITFLDGFDNDALGGYEMRPCATLLFYEQVGNECHSNFQFPELIKRIIDQENSEFARIQALFSHEILRFISVCKITVHVKFIWPIQSSSITLSPTISCSKSNYRQWIGSCTFIDQETSQISQMKLDTLRLIV